MVISLTEAMSVLARLRTLFRLFLLFTVLVTVALMSAITTIRLTIHGHQETMPKMIGMPLDSAQRMASGLGFELKVEDKLYNTEYPANRIVSQVPPPGTRVKMGQHVHVLVSLGPPQESVPNLLGSSVRGAKIRAIQRGLNLGDIAFVHWKESEPDQVVAQDPPAARAEVHSPALSLLVSIGDVPEAFLCPNFHGKPFAEVRRMLERRGFKVGNVTPIPTDIPSKGRILAQTPPPGSKIGSDTVFDFQVSQ
jgi:eukaryotic-like serine/threonine-protein kinase